MKNYIAVAFCASGLFLFGCSEHVDSNTASEPRSDMMGIYRFSLLLDPEELPFTGDLKFQDDSWKLIIYNGKEEIEVDDITVTEDSIIARMPVFQSELRGRIESPDLITGSFINYSRDDTTSISFNAEKGKNYRFTNTKSSTILPEQYHARFTNPDKTFTESILILTSDQGKLNGSFLTETGDYRYLEGNIMNESVYLSGFDGAHAYYFEARIAGDSLVNGIFRSGPKSITTWSAASDTTFFLRRPDQLTYLKEGYEFIDFRLPNQDGDSVSWENLNLQGKVVILDMMGSWCPNCMDATLALKKLSEPYSDDDLRVIPIAFELTEDFQVAKKRINKMQKDLQIDEEFLFGGYASKENATVTFPMLNHIMSYPTIVIIDRNRDIRLIYTGFYGPGTGKYHTEFMDQMSTLISELVKEDN